MSEVVEFEKLGSVGVARLIREKPLNSLLLETIDSLSEQIFPWLEDAAVPCLLLDSSSERAFCAGADITALYHAIKKDGGDSEYAQNFFCNEYRLDYALHTSTKPVIVWGQGIVMGGGLGLLGGCSHRIATPQTRIAMPEITIGLFPDAGGTWFLSQMRDNLGVFAGLTGCQLSAGDAQVLGLIDHVVESESKVDIMRGLATMGWSEVASERHAQIDDLINQYAVSESLPTNLMRCQETIKPLMQNCLDDPDFLTRFEEAFDSFGDSIEDEWLSRSVKTYRSGSPTTARIFLEQMKRARDMTLPDMFRMELVIAYQCARHDDFPEGVRALLVDKDKNPQWRYQSAVEIPDSYVAEHFEAPWSGAHPLANL